MQDSGLVNAGKGSNKNAEGNYEFDTGLMASNPFSFAAIGAARNCLNPITEARKLLIDVQNRQKLSR